MVVVAEYSDGNIKTVEDYTVSPLTPLTATDTQATISYNGRQTTVDITVVKQNDFSVLVDRKPIRSLYVAGERFDKTGMRLAVSSEGKTSYVYNFAVPDAALTAGDEKVTIGYLGKQVEIPVTVVNGKPTEFSSPYTAARYDEMVSSVAAESGGDTIKGFVSDYELVTLLDEPFPNGVSSFDEFVKQADYYVFYRVESFVIKVSFDFDDVETLLDALYITSDLLASTASVKGQALEGGYVQVVVKYYGGDMIVSKPESVNPYFAEGSLRSSKRPKNYDFGVIDGDNGVTVYDSDRLIFALSLGKKVAPVKDSPAEKALEKATEILVSICDDDMTAFEKAYAIYIYLITNAVYDDYADESVGKYCLDKKYESDMLAARFTSFYADGALLYGSAVCYGYSKAFSLLALLEGLDVKRVVAQHVKGSGRSAFLIDESYSVYTEFYIHSYNYFRVDGRDYLCDLTYSNSGAAPTNYGDVNVFRNLCLAMTKDEHYGIYDDITEDKVSASEEYTPADFSYQSEFTYDGENDYLCDDLNSADRYIEYLLSAQAAQNAKSVYLPVYLNAKLFDSSAKAASYAIEKALSVSGRERAYRITSTIYLNSERYYLVSICLA